MKVERGGSRTTGGESRPSAPARKTGASFVEAISEAKKDAVERDHDKLVTEIEEQARLLVKKRTITEMTKYRELVTGLMKRIVEDSIEMKEVPSAKYLENQKVFVVAKKIEEKLLELAEKIRSGTAEALEIVAATSEIRGMLLDIKG